MNFNFEDCSLEELKKGYTYDPKTKLYQCLACGERFETGEIFCLDGRYYEAYRAVELHIKTKHESMFHQLLHSPSKYNSFTDKQKQLLLMIRDGLTDQEIASALQISTSTVRHQKYTFREKAKQARHYLAVFEQAFGQAPSETDTIMPIHDGATMVDDRYMVTQAESDKIIETVFESLNPLKLKIFSAKEKKKIVTLRKITEQFEKGKIYPEKELNRILKDIYHDYATIRRYLIEYGFMERSKDCKEYWVK